LNSDFSGRIVVSFESRRAADAARLIERAGGVPLSAPTMRELPLEENPQALSFAERLFAGEVDVLLLLTGVGTRTLADAVATRYPRDRFVEALKGVTLVARGPKPVKALAEMGLTPQVRVPEPNTWRELLETLDRECPVADKHVVVQEYGVSNPDLLAGLEARGAQVTMVPVYRWALPEDTGPMQRAIREVAEGRVQAALFTSANQVHNLFQVAGKMERADALRAGFAGMTVGSIGPITNDALAQHGVTPDHVATRPFLGVLIQELAAASGAG